MSIYRCYTEKKRDFDIEAKLLLHELNDFVKISGLESLRIFNRYDIEGIDNATYEKAKYTVLSKPQIDYIYDETLPEMESELWSLTIEASPGQYDQRADACSQSIQLITLDTELPKVRTAKHYVFYGNISENDKAHISNYLINPLESQIASAEKPDTLVVTSKKPDMVKTVKGFISADDNSLLNYLDEYNMAMDIADLRFLQSYFSDTEKRDPTETELRVIDTYWSDHCRHTTFFTHLNDIKIKDPDVRAAYETYLSARDEVYGDGKDKRPCTLMDIATIAAKTLMSRGKLTNIDISDEVNACSIHIDAVVDGKSEDWLLMFKNETHNHPTEVEPFGGAATCVGGAIRDPLSGRAYVYQAMRITGSGDPRTLYKDTIPSKIPQRKLTITAARGNSSYGNQIGLPTGFLHEIYHPGYQAKRMELGAVVAAARADNVVRETPKPGDKVVLLGGRTGRDGVGGATGSSKTQTNVEYLSLASEVQKGNAQEERKIQRLFLNPAVTKMIKKCNDFGAGGVSVAVGELADGIDINLSKVLLKYDGLNGTEIALSESQERMAIVLASDDVEKFISFANEEDLEAYVVAEVTENPRMIMRHDGDIIVNISREFLSTNGATRQATIEVSKSSNTLKPTAVKLSPSDRLRALVSDIRYCSQQGLYNMFDGSVGSSSVLMKSGGVTGDTPPQVMVSLLPVEYDKNTTTCSVMAYGYDPYLSELNPFLGAKNAVITSVAKLVASGCNPTLAYLTFQEYFERLKDDPVRWGKPFAALLGAFEAQIELGLAAIGGKDSMSGSYNELDVPPTLVSFAIAPSDSAYIISPEFKSPNNDVVLFNSPKSSNGLMGVWKKVRALIKDGVIVSAWAVTDGGVIEGLFKMALGNKIGFETSENLNLELLFENVPGTIVAEVTEPVSDAMVIGKTTSEPVFNLNGDIINLSDLRSLWAQPLENVFPATSSVLNVKPHEANVKKIRFETPSVLTPTSKFKKPRVLILAAPGAIGEFDAARSVSNAGGVAEIELIRSSSPDVIKESIAKIKKALSNSQILILPAAATFGDEPDGAAKFLLNFMQIPDMADSLLRFIRHNDSLTLGLGNGFQALVNLGLLPFGDIVDSQKGYNGFSVSDKPVFSLNPTGMYYSSYVNTRIASVKSPWLNNLSVDDIFTVPISNGEGRLTASDKILDFLIENGQISSQYCDINGNPSMAPDVNPSSSAMAIEGLLSPDGRILGKIGHFERYNKHTAKNIYGNKHQPIIENGINYFR